VNRCAKDAFDLDDPNGRVAAGRTLEKTQSVQPEGANPGISSSLLLMRSIRSSFEPEALSGRNFIPRIWQMEQAHDLVWFDDTPSDNLYNASIVPFSRSMLENMLHGLVKDQDGSLIKNAFKVVLTSSDSPEKDVMGEIEAAASRALLKDAVYDSCFVLVSDPVTKKVRMYRQLGPLDLAGGQRMDPTDLRFERVDETLTIKLGFRKKGMVGLNIN
jgi:hypothetical protein